MAATPKDAATLILLRQSQQKARGNFEILMVLRHMKSKFVPGSYVFPGGCLDQEDCLAEMESLCTGVSMKKAQTILRNMSSPEKAMGAWIGAIRETFEEVGLLLAYDSDKQMVSFNADDVLNRFRLYRKRLQEGEMTLRTILKNESMTLATDRLHYFSHWITPELLPLRYDVRFFVAEAPPYQMAIHDGIELTRHVWITPQEILDGFARKEFDMVVPTLVTIEEISRYRTIQEVIDSTKNKTVKAILTVMVKEDGGIVEYMTDGRVFKNMPPSV